jgi:hypothetical protein
LTNLPASPNKEAEMRSFTITTLILVCSLSYSVEMPRIMSYQGLLTDSNGAPVPDGIYDLTFRLYDAPEDGNQLWVERHTGVETENGLFDLLVGSQEPLDLPFMSQYWVALSLSDGGELTPRILLAGAPYSFNAQAVSGFSAASSPEPNVILPLDAEGKFPEEVLPEISFEIPDGSITTDKLADNAATTVKIQPDVISSISGVSNDGGNIDLVAGSNITVTPDDGSNTITIDAAGGGGGDITAVWPGDNTLYGGGDQGDVTLRVANPLEIYGSSDGVIKGTHSNGHYGWLGRSNGTGVHGYTPTGLGVYGEGGNGGVCGYSSSAHGVVGSADGAAGVYGQSSGYGVDGWNTTNSNSGYLGGGTAGAYGLSYAGSWGALGRYNFGVYGYMNNVATDWAGYFDGDVAVTGQLAKGSGTFLIDHPLDPENKLLRHSFVESPENLLIYRGRNHLDATGESVVELPSYFQALTREAEASIHLTPVGRPFLTGADWKAGFQSFTIYGDPDRDVFWQVLVERDDPVMRQQAKPVEEVKSPDNKLCKPGRLLYPEAYGYPETMGARYAERDTERIRYEERIRSGELTVNLRPSEPLDRSE